MTPSHALLQRARRCHDEGRFVAAADFLLEAFRSDSSNPEVACELGKVLRAIGDLEGALAYLKRAWHHQPTDSVTVAELVLTLHDLDRSEEAVQVMLGSLEAGLDDTAFAMSLIRD